MKTGIFRTAYKWIWAFAPFLIIADISAGEETIYAAQPSWWTSVALKLPETVSQAKTADELWQALTKSNPQPVRNFEDWNVIGPFDDTDGTGLNIVYPPETEISRKPLSGKDGQPVEWKQWKSNADPLPVSADITNAIFYAYKDVELKTLQNGYVTVRGDDDIKLWLNGKPVITRINAKNSDRSILIVMPPGKYRFLVKIHQKDGTWSFRVGWSATDINKQEIKLRSMVCAKFSGDTGKVLMHAQHLAALYAGLGELPNARFWVRYILSKDKDRALLSPVLETLVTEDADAYENVLFTELDAAFKKTGDENLKKLYADKLVRHAFLRENPDTAMSFLKAGNLPVSTEQAMEAIALYQRKRDAKNVDRWFTYILNNEKNDKQLADIILRVGKRMSGDSNEFIYQKLTKAYQDAAGDDVRKRIADIFLALAFESKDPRSAAVFLSGFQRPPAADQARSLLALYKDMPRDEAAFGWAVSYLAAGPDEKEAAATIDALDSFVTDETLPYYYTVLEDAFTITTNPKARDLLATRFVESALARSDPQRLMQFLEDHRSVLEMRMKFQTALWLTRANIADGDRDGARLTLEEAMKINADFKKSPEYKAIDQQIFGMKASQLRPALVDLSHDKVIRDIKKSADSNDRNELHRMIRDLLLDKACFAEQDSADPMLYVGVKTLYRAELQNYKSSYEPYLSDYATSLVEKGGFSKEAARTKQMAASLATAGPVVQERARGGTRSIETINPGKSLEEFLPLVKLDPGAFELRARETAFRMGNNRALVLSHPVEDGELVFIQNSREMTCFKGNTLVWAQVVPCSAIWSKENYPFYFGSVKAPVIAGSLVIGRFVSEDGPVLAAMDKASGVIRWIFKPQQAALTSDPAIWGQSTCCVQGIDNTKDQETTYLLFLDVNTGRETGRMPVSRGLQPIKYQEGLKVMFSCNMPAPLIDGDTAFLENMNGSFASVNLRDQSLQWVRIYPRQQDMKAVSLRQFSHPVVGTSNVLFGSIDSRCLLLVNRDKGTLAGKEMSLKWREVGPAGEDTAVVITASGASFYSLTSLKLVKKVEAENLSYVQGGTDGCILYNGKSITGYSSSGVKVFRTAIRPDAIPVFFGRRAYAFGSEAPHLFGFISADKAAGPASYMALRSAPADMLNDPLPVRTSEGILLKCSEYIAFMDSTGERTWDLPALKDSQVLSVSNLVAVFQAGTVSLYELKTGRRKLTWPSREEAGKKIITRLTQSGDMLFAEVTEKSEDKPVNSLYSIKGGGEIGLLGTIPEKVENLRAVDGGNCIIGSSDRGSICVRKRQETDAATHAVQYSLVREFVSKKWDMRPKYAVSSDGLDYWILDPENRKVWSGRGDTFREIEIQGFGELRMASCEWREGLIYCRIDGHGNNPKLFFADPSNGKSHVLEEFSYNKHWLHRMPRWTVKDRKLYVLAPWSKTGSHGFAMQMIDFAADGKAPRVSSEETIADPMEYKGTPIGPVIVGNRIVYPFYISDWNQKYQRPTTFAVIQSEGSTQSRMVQLPFISSCRQIARTVAVFNETLIDSKALDLFMNTAALIRNIAGEQTIDSMSLMKGWKVKRAADDKELGDKFYRPDMDDSGWEPADVSEGNIPYQEARIFYRKSVDIPSSWNGKRSTISFNGVDDEAVVYVNGQKVGEHVGAYDEEFTFDTTAALHTGTNLVALLCRNNTGPGGIWQPVSISASGKGGASKGAPVVQGPNVIVDGFFDEWSRDEFVRTPNGACAIRRRGNDLWIAIEVTNPQILRELSLYGADNNLDLHVVRAAEAGFVQDTGAIHSIRETDKNSQRISLTTAGQPEDWAFAYSVPPSGRSCRIEVCLKKVEFLPKIRKGQQPLSADAQAFGDIAVRLLWQSGPWRPSYNLLEKPRTGPLSFTRLILPN